MKILLTGATGYIAQRLLPVLLDKGHEVICCVRDTARFNYSKYRSSAISAVEVDFLKPSTLQNIPADIDVAYYLIHSMSTHKNDFEKMEEISASNFRDRIQQTKVRQVIYLSGIVNQESLSRHLGSRRNVERILGTGTYSLTTLRAGIIIGSGSASFEIIRDLVEKLPVMIAPRWLNTRSQPIAVKNVIEFLSGVLLNEKTFNSSYDIGGPDILTYKQMLLSFARVRGLKRRIWTVPVMTPKLSSYWLYFITSTSYSLAQNLVDSMKIEVICKENDLREMLSVEPVDYEEAVREAFRKIEMNEVVSSWKDAFASGILDTEISKFAEVPVHGCYFDRRELSVADVEKALERIWSLGGTRGWYYGNWLWGLRGFVDKLSGGVGLRRGRKNQNELSAGDALDFWRVLIADKEGKRLLLFAEMKLPGEAWLEFRIDEDKILHQTATFRPLGLWGRLYWFSVLPFHAFIFRGLIRKIA
ncbi:MAG: SDR family oxidoreductase [Bacteroidales bacterium]|nr:SDR family oxidoreductase [Bacteroidales bacterium]MBN2634117.1 SDR family oxidoreductase [Bacteroidales bacterium]